jgi:hypothetical protein
MKQAQRSLVEPFKRWEKKNLNGFGHTYTYNLPPMDLYFARSKKKSAHIQEILLGDAYCLLLPIRNVLLHSDTLVSCVVLLSFVPRLGEF